MTNPILTQIHAAAPQLHSVTINPQGVKRFCRNFNVKKIKHWHTISPFPINTLPLKDRLHFILLLNTISFSYWGQPKWRVIYKGKQYDGAQAMMASLGRAVESDALILEPYFWRSITAQKLGKILSGSVQIPLLHQRAEHLRTVGESLTKNYENDFENWLIRSSRNALSLTSQLVNAFPCFADSRIYSGHEIHFNKRAQLLIADLWYACNDELHRPITGIHHLTACADYKLPQVLRRYRVLEYSPDLTAKIRQRNQIAVGSHDEIAIRSKTILAVERIKNQLQNEYPSITANQINDYLWLEGQEKPIGQEPYHLTRTTAY